MVMNSNGRLENFRGLAKWNEYKGSSYKVITPAELPGFVINKPNNTMRNRR